MIRLTIIDAQGERTISLDRTEVLLGRREGVDLALGDSAASRNHCLLRAEGNKVVLIDLGSQNGTRVRGKKVQQADLSPGDEFRIGKTVVRLESTSVTGLALEADPAPSPPPRGGAPVPGQVEPSFADELRATLRQTPWYGISLAAHVILLMVLDLFDVDTIVIELQRPIVAVNVNDVAPPDADLEQYEPDLRELEPPDLDERELEEPEDADDNTQKKAVNDEFEEYEKPDQDRRLGIARSLTHKIKPLTISPKMKQPGAPVDKSNIKAEQGNAKTVVERSIGRGLKTMRGLKRGRILVVRGDFDKIENILDLYRINHTPISKERLVSGSFPRAEMLCINCARKPTSALKRKLVARVKRFVDRGGWLITSDWSVDPYLTEGWPQHVETVPTKRRQPNTTVMVREVDRMSPLLKQVFGRRTQTRWWLEEQSTLFRIKGKRARVLVESDEMMQRYGAREVVIEFSSSKGRVLHLLGHFWQKDGNRGGLVAMHRLILNYMHERFVKNKDG